MELCQDDGISVAPRLKPVPEPFCTRRFLEKRELKQEIRATLIIPFDGNQCKKHLDSVLLSIKQSTMTVILLALQTTRLGSPSTIIT